MRTLIVLAFVLIALAGCHPSSKDKKVQGNGIVEDSLLYVNDFRDVVASGEYNLLFVQDSTQQIVLEAESNILPLIDVYVVNNKLVIENETNYKFDLNYPINITIHHEGVFDIDYSGAGKIALQTLESSADFSSSISGTCTLIGDIIANNISFTISGDGTILTSVYCHDIDVSVSGTGHIDLKGDADDGMFDISGVGNVYAYDLPLKNCYTSISGIGDNFFSVSDYLNVSISGVGNIYYKGNPDVDQDISGVGTVKKVN